MSHCSICLENTKDPFHSKCSHAFCNKCIMQWITQHDDCPLCRNPISDTPTVNNYNEDVRDYYIINLERNTLSKEEEEEVDNRLNDFINTIDEELCVYKWQELNNGLWYTTIRKHNYCIDIKIDVSPNFILNDLRFDNYYNININLHKREFYTIKQSKYKKKQFKLSNSKKSSYLFR